MKTGEKLLGVLDRPEEEREGSFWTLPWGSLGWGRAPGSVVNRQVYTWRVVYLSGHVIAEQIGMLAKVNDHH